MVGDGVSTATHVRPAAVARAPEGREVAPSGGFIVGRAVVSGRRGGDSRANQRSRPPSGGSRKLNSTKSDSASVSSIRAYQEMKRNNWQSEWSCIRQCQPKPMTIAVGSNGYAMTSIGFV